jgi:hypothetical protein
MEVSIEYYRVAVAQHQPPRNPAVVSAQRSRETSMPQQRLLFVQTSRRKASSVSDDISELSSQQLCESQTSQCQSLRPRTASAASCAKPRTSWVFSHMPDEEIETRYYNQRTEKEEWRCKQAIKRIPVLVEPRLRLST